MARGERHAGKLLDHREHRIGTGARCHDALPVWEELDERRCWHRLDLVTQGGHGAPTDLAQDLDVAPLAAAVIGAEPSRGDAAPLGKALKRSGGDGHSDAECIGDLVCGERPVRARKSGDQVAQRVVDQVEIGVGDPRRQRHAQGIPQSPRILDGREVIAPGDAHDDGATLRYHFVSECVRDAACRARIRIEWADDAQQVEQRLGIDDVEIPAAHGTGGLLDGVGVEDLA